ncbi:hypothetical protein UlMin_041451 [Ulmus minor]
MACITSVSYSVLINGAKFGQLFPTRGLRQGDPLSPYLFLLCAEGLSSLFHHFEAAGRIQGMRCGRNGPTISHLFFADDSLLFFEASTDSCLAVKEALTCYETASGQLVVKRFLPRELHCLCAQFWWGGNNEKKRMHWCTWERLCVHKLNGGMGFRDMRLFNKAILAKQAWRILTCPSSLAARVLQGFYFTNSTFLQVRKTSSASFVWRSILWGRELLMQGSRRKIGLGNDTYIYHDRWLPRDGSFRISSPRVLGELSKVSLLKTATGQWNSSLITDSFHPDEAAAILSLPTPNRPTADSLTWHYNKRGHYTVRSGYWVAKGGMETISSSSSSNHIPWWKQF